MTSVAASRNGRPKRRIGRILRGLGIGLLVMIAVLAISGALWNWLAIRADRARYPAPGKMYTVDGHTMHLYCSGTGSPTLILDAGLGDDWTAWQKVQPTLSKITQVCSFDRSGLGWSDELSPDHDANTLADQLHALLKVAGITKPIILMGHSIAGLYDRAYAARYPGDVAGLIFVDASSPDQFKRLPELNSSPLLFTALKWSTAFGLTRAAGLCSQVTPGLEFERGFIYANRCKISVISTNGAEFKDIDRSNDETRHTGPFGDLPILVLSEDTRANTDSLPPDVEKKFEREWESMQEDLKHLSARGRRIIAKGSSHYVQVDRADLVNREVPVFIQQVRSGAISADNGSTKTE
jgi:pimeloyl-ACP methyl ester carboxylesterase